MLLRDVNLRVGRQNGSAANSNEKRKFHGSEIGDPRPLSHQHTHCLSRIYGITVWRKSNGVVIFVGAHARRDRFSDIHCVLRKWRALLDTRSISYLHL